MKIVRRVSMGEMVPRFYGVAWIEYRSHNAICLPVPLNLPAALLRRFWLFLCFSPVRSSFDSQGEAYAAGFRDGCLFGDRMGQ